jgi:hypothetical protein
MGKLDDIMAHCDAFEKRLKEPPSPIAEPPVREKAFKPDVLSKEQKHAAKRKYAEEQEDKRAEEDDDDPDSPATIKGGGKTNTERLEWFNKDSAKPDATGQHKQSPLKAVGATKKILEPKKQVPDSAKADKHLGFQKLKGELAHKKGVHDPGAVAAYIGRKKYGQKAMTAKSVAGRK